MRRNLNGVGLWVKKRVSDGRNKITLKKNTDMVGKIRMKAYRFSHTQWKRVIRGTWLDSSIWTWLVRVECDFGSSSWASSCFYFSLEPIEFSMDRLDSSRTRDSYAHRAQRASLWISNIKACPIASTLFSHHNWWNFQKKKGGMRRWEGRQMGPPRDKGSILLILQLTRIWTIQLKFEYQVRCG